MRRKIAFTGKMRSGKDYLARYMRNKHFYKRFAFGDEIRRVTKELYPEQFADGAKPRSLLQEFGEMAREHDRDVWVKALFRSMEENSHDIFDGRVVVTDLRQPHEFDALRRNGFVIVKVEADDEVRLERMRQAGDRFTEEMLNHPTESYIDGFAADYVITNNGDSDAIAEIEKIIWGRV